MPVIWAKNDRLLVAHPSSFVRLGTITAREGVASCLVEQPSVLFPGPIGVVA